MEKRSLGRTGLRVSALGFGASPLGDVFGKVDEAEGIRAVQRAVELGIYYFDVSPFYGLTLAEERLGRALRPLRDDVVLSTKCGRYGMAQFDFSAGRIETSVEQSLARLGTDHVDLLFLHDIEFADRRQILEEALPAARRVQEAGKTRFVGISGLPLRCLRDVAETGDVDVVLSYAHYNLMAQDLDEVLTPAARKRGFGLINASPLHLGILTETGPPPWHKADAEVRATGAAVVELCRRHGADPAAVALRFAAAHPIVATTLVGMHSVRQVEENVAALEASPDGEAELLVEIAELVAPVRNRVWSEGRPENHD